MMGGLRWAVSLAECESSPSFESLFRRSLQCISADDVSRQARFVFRNDSLSCIIGRLLCRQAVCNMFSVPWHSIVFGRTDRGKPYLINPPRKFQFNISHQGDIIVLASSEGEPIGVDVMRIDEERTSFWTHIQRMHKLFSSNELQMMKNQEDDKQRWTAFYRVWCLKESVLKATGTGLVNDLSSLDFTTSDEKHVPGCFITSTSWSQSSIPQPNWLFEESFVGDSHCVAVARILEPEFVEKERKLSQENSFNFITFEQLLNGSSVVNLMDDEATDQYSLFKLKPLKAI